LLSRNIHAQQLLQQLGLTPCALLAQALAGTCTTLFCCRSPAPTFLPQRQDLTAALVADFGGHFTSELVRSFGSVLTAKIVLGMGADFTGDLVRAVSEQGAC
jgi:hypothetical protein